MTQEGHAFLLHRAAASELDPISEILLGVSPRAFSRASIFCLGAQIHRGEPFSSTNSPHQKSRRSGFARAPSRLQFCDSFLSRASTCFSFTTRKLGVLATPTLLHEVRGGTINFWTRSMRLHLHRTPCLYLERSSVDISSPLLLHHDLTRILRVPSTLRI